MKPLNAANASTMINVGSTRNSFPESYSKNNVASHGKNNTHPIDRMSLSPISERTIQYRALNKDAVAVSANHRIQIGDSRRYCEELLSELKLASISFAHWLAIPSHHCILVFQHHHCVAIDYQDLDLLS